MLFQIHYSIKGGRVSLDCKLQETYSCAIKIDRAIRNDNGTWKAVMKSLPSNGILGIGTTCHEYSQAVKVQGKCCMKSQL